MATESADLTTLLAELDTKVAKMTPGPWTVEIDEYDTGEYNISIPEIRRSLHDSEWADPKEAPRDTANAHGIVALVSAYPALKEGIAQLQRERDEAQAEAVEQARLNGLGSEREARLRAQIEQLQREKATDAWHTGWQQAVKERDEARRECDQWREKWNATLDREARRNAEILQLKAANNEMREVLLTLSTADPKLLAEQPEMTAGIARMALQLANHWAAKGSVDAA